MAEVAAFVATAAVAVVAGEFAVVLAAMEVDVAEVEAEVEELKEVAVVVVGVKVAEEPVLLDVNRLAKDYFALLIVARFLAPRE